MQLNTLKFSLLVLVLGVLPALCAANPTNPESEALAMRAQQILDGLDHSGARLAEADRAVAASLREQPNAHALVEQARLAMIHGGESPASFAAASDALRQAEALDDSYDRTHVVASYVALRTGDLKRAQESLAKARALNSADPWFKLNWALYYQTMRQEKPAIELQEEVVRSNTSNEGALRFAMTRLQEHYADVGDRGNAERMYRLAAAHWPDNAYVRGDFARDVMVHFADFDAGEKAAREALSIMDYPHARQSVSLALYGRWAAAKRDHAEMAVVGTLLDDARAYDPQARMVPTCALRSPKLFFLRDALMALEGKFDPSRRNC